MILIDNYKDVVMNKYATFTGRATRSEYWWFVLGSLIISVALSIIDSIMFDSKSGVLQPLFSLAVLVPSIAVGIRRLHDIGKSGWWILISIIPIIGWIIALIFAVTDSQPMANQYGPNPKGANTSGGSNGSTGSATYDTTATAAPAPAPSAPAPESTPVPDPLVHGDSNSASV